jgi:hypothetical protein
MSYEKTIGKCSTHKLPCSLDKTLPGLAEKLAKINAGVVLQWDVINYFS